VKVARQKNVELDPCLCFLLRKRFQWRIKICWQFWFGVKNQFSKFY
jgi:hypothetical protein